MRTSAYSALALGLGLSFSLSQLSACSNSSEDCNATATCGSSGSGSGTSGSSGTGGSSAEGGSEGAGTSSGGGGSGVSGSGGSGGSSGNGGAGGAGGCEGDVSDDAACWATSEYGVFVSNEHGDDATGTGTKEAPFATITKGLSAAGGKKVFVCLGPKGDYTDALTLDQVEDVSIYGGFECETWEYSTSRKAGIKPERNIGIRISRSKQVLLENLRITASDATGTGYDASSYGAFVTESEGVVLRRVELKAGNGAKGVDGADGVKGDNGSVKGAEQDGEPGLCGVDKVADGKPGTWPGLVCGSRGGTGGSGSVDVKGGDGFSGIPMSNVTPADEGLENGGTGTSGSGAGGFGTPGGVGKNGELGAAGLTVGSFSSSGYVVADGNAGTNGFPGQGGGGGGASRGTPMCRGASGGAGGMGGCGGTAGKGGGGGGASVGLMSWSSEVQLEACSVASATGGAGGKGGDGGGPGIGAKGGFGGDPDTQGNVAAGGDGGRGGNGGLGGSGSGGTGGASYGLVYFGAKPLFSLDDTTMTPGKGGAEGPGGQAAMAAPKAFDGAKGASGTELEVE